MMLKQAVLLEENEQSVSIFLGKSPSGRVKRVTYVAALSYLNSGLLVPHIAFMIATLKARLITATSFFDLENIILSKMTSSKERVSF